MSINRLPSSNDDELDLGRVLSVNEVRTRLALIGVDFQQADLNGEFSNLIHEGMMTERKMREQERNPLIWSCLKMSRGHHDN